ncbi:MAG TPA: tRNA (adenosine(37)-N6)-dimethylallyltransferase MiaA [Dehalococcoidia bacterium]|nr:tRNA (adenosine(37)-N6)-dimethylallyltransferase MiaA [Dehalococcoidia bacterium]
MAVPLVAVVGPTATGKTALAVELARALGGEILNADSRQVYRGMDIGTAKPTAAEQAAARHWLIDCVDPDERYSLAAFLDGARGALDDIAARGMMPVVAGGTGQYVWALIEGWTVPRVEPDASLRAELEALAARDGSAAVAAVLEAEDPPSADSIDLNNVRRMIRAIEVTRATGRRFSEWQEKTGPPLPDVRIIGLGRPRDGLYARIDARVDAMIAAGLVDEVRALITAGYGCELASMSGIGYRQVCAYLRGEVALEAAVAEIKTDTHRLARMQHTWFRGDDARIHWLDAGAPDLRARALAIVRAPAG